MRRKNGKMLQMFCYDSKLENLQFLPPNSERKGEGGLRTKGHFPEHKSDRNRSDYPLVTIVTVVFNGEQFLERTIQSVLNQTYKNIEYIIIDGGSKDGTLDIIRKYENQIDYWVSEPDQGLYHAMNKGIQLATGEIIGLINSDDWYLENTIDFVVNKYLQSGHQKVIITGAIYRTDDEGNIQFKLNKSENFFRKNINVMNPVNHPATFVSAEVYADIGLFNTTYKICGDHDLMYKAYYSNAIDFMIVDDCLACMTLGGVSEQMSLKTLWLIVKEGYQIRKYNTPLFKNIIIAIYILCRGLLKRLLKYLFNDNLLSLYYRYRHGKSH